MGCGKSKHAVETATTVIKSTNSDGTKHTTTATATKTVKETTTGSSLIQKESLHVEEINTSDPSAVADVAPARVLEDDVDANDSNPTDNVAPTSAEVVRGDEKVNDSSPDGSVVSTVVPTSIKDNVGTPEVVKEDEGKREPALTADTNAKTDNVVPAEEDKTKESNLTADNKTKNEFLTPTLSEEVVGPFDVVAKGNEDVKDSKDENPVNTGDGLKVENQLVVQASESTKVEVKRDEEAVEVTETDIVKAKISVPTETEKAATTSEPNVAETQEKKP